MRGARFGSARGVLNGLAHIQLGLVRAPRWPCRSARRPLPPWAFCSVRLWLLMRPTRPCDANPAGRPWRQNLVGDGTLRATESGGRWPAGDGTRRARKPSMPGNGGCTSKERGPASRCPCQCFDRRLLAAAVEHRRPLPAGGLALICDPLCQLRSN